MMELALNLLWAVVAVAGTLFWLAAPAPKGQDRRSQMVALALLLLIAFPIISVTDDFWAGQNPAETDRCLKWSDARHFLASETPIVVPLWSPKESSEISIPAPEDQPFPFPQTLQRCTLFTRPPPVG